LNSLSSRGTTDRHGERRTKESSGLVTVTGGFAQAKRERRAMLVSNVLIKRNGGFPPDDAIRTVSRDLPLVNCGYER
jgi:hypothetical protein